jgi:hypothetical protein
MKSTDKVAVVVVFEGPRVVQGDADYPGTAVEMVRGFVSDPFYSRNLMPRFVAVGSEEWRPSQTDAPMAVLADLESFLRAAAFKLFAETK